MGLGVQLHLLGMGIETPAHSAELQMLLSLWDCGHCVCPYLAHQVVNAWEHLHLTNGTHKRRLFMSCIPIHIRVVWQNVLFKRLVRRGRCGQWGFRVSGVLSATWELAWKLETLSSTERKAWTLVKISDFRLLNSPEFYSLYHPWPGRLTLANLRSAYH